MVIAFLEPVTPPRRPRHVSPYNLAARLERLGAQRTLRDVVRSVGETEAYIQTHGVQFHRKLWRQAAIEAVQLRAYQTLQLALRHVNFGCPTFRRGLLLTAIDANEFAYVATIFEANRTRPAAEHFTMDDLSEGLIAAVDRGQVALVSTLISAGARANHVSAEGEESAIDVAVWRGDVAVLRVLFIWDREAQRDSAALMRALRNAEALDKPPEVRAYLQAMIDALHATSQ